MARPLTATTRPVVVVGAGFAGLAAACHLRRLGHDVVVCEASSGPGGRAGVCHADGFRFDTGPTVVTMVDSFRAIFAAVDASLDDFCTLQRVDPAYRANFADGTSLALHADLERTASDIAAFASPSDAAGFRSFVHWVSELYRVEFGPFIDHDVRSVADLARHPLALARLARLGGFGRWQAKVRQLTADERLHRLLTFQALYAGVSPLDALGLFAVIAFMDTVGGVYTPIGGTQALAEGLATAAGKAGVTFRYDTPVQSVVPGPHGCQVELAEQERLEASAVVITADLPLAYRDLLERRPPRRVARAAFAPSCMVWHLRNHGPLPPQTAHHNIYFGNAWAEAFDDLLTRGRPAADPSRFVTVASVSDPTAAPDGAHGLYVLEPVPNLGADVDWSATTPRLTERMLTWASATGFAVDDADLVTCIDPPVWRQRGAAQGTPFSFAHLFRQSGPFRPSPAPRDAPGVFLAGAGTRPGLGLPMVTISGRIAAERADRFVRGRKGGRR